MYNFIRAEQRAGSYTTRMQVGRPYMSHDTSTTEWRPRPYALESSFKAPTSTLQVPQYDRIHSRLITGGSGISLDRFTTIPELLGALRDAIDAHRDLQSHGILHHDISFGNVLIAPHAESCKRGMLVDFDYAGPTDSGSFHDDERSGTMIYMGIETVMRQGIPSEEFQPGFGMDSRKSDSPTPTSVARARLDNFTSAPKPAAPSTSQTLIAHEASRVFTHGILHELESFWLVLVWIGVKRAGPCTERSFVDKDHCISEVTGAQQRYIHDFFDSSVEFYVLGQRRLDLFRGGLKAFDEHVVPALSPYCAVLGPLLADLFLLIGRAYVDNSLVDKLYDDFLAAIDCSASHRNVLAWDDPGNANSRAGRFREAVVREWIQRRKDCFLPNGKFPAKAVEFLEASMPDVHNADAVRSVLSDTTGRTARKRPATNGRVNFAYVLIPPRKRSRTSSNIGTGTATFPATAESSGSYPLSPPSRRLRSSAHQDAATDHPVEAPGSGRVSRGNPATRRPPRRKATTSLPDATTSSDRTTRYTGRA